MSLRLPLLALVVFLFAGSLLGQQEETLASKFTLDFSGAWGGWHPQISEVGGNSTVVNGGFGGLEFNKTLFIGWAAYRNSDVLSLTDSTTASYNLSFNGPMIAYTPRARSVIHPMFALQVGFGKFDIQDLPRDRFIALQPSVGGEVNVLRWFRLGAQFGYRYSLNSDFESDSFGSTDSFFAEASLKFGFSWGTGSLDGLQD